MVSAGCQSAPARHFGSDNISSPVHTMNTLPLLIAALVMLPAVGVALWAWSTMQRAERDLRTDAGLEHADFDIGTWPSSSPARLA